MVRSLIILMVLSGCVRNPNSDITGDNVAVIIEGLGDLPFAKKVYEKPLMAMGYKVYVLNYKYSKPIKANVCIGHSFGGGRLMKDDVNCKIVFTLDAREWKFSNNDSYVSKHPLHYNFYQTSGLRGYPIKNAFDYKKPSKHLKLPEDSKDHILKIIYRAAAEGRL